MGSLINIKIFLTAKDFPKLLKEMKTQTVFLFFALLAAINAESSDDVVTRTHTYNWKVISSYVPGAEIKQEKPVYNNVETFGGNSNGANCVFPYVYAGRKYTSCTKVGRTDGYTWCATTSNYDTDKKWGLCSTGLTYGGNAKGKPCHLPFQYGDEYYYSCTRKGRTDGKLWCATEFDYGRHLWKWGFCRHRA